MQKRFNGRIELDIRDSVQDWDPYLAPRASEGAPNVLIIAWDDVGFSTMDTFGGLVQMPTMQRIADRGVKFSNFHTTALCSPTRASLLTGRNATTNGMATVAEFSSGFPGISTRIPFENGFISEVLMEHGYNTYAIGKWHLTPGDECNHAAYKGRWPLGRGFERFYGWLGGETNSWYPDLVYDNHQVDPPGRPEDGYHFADDMADKAIEFIRDAKVIDPDKPFLHVPRSARRTCAPSRLQGMGRQVQRHVRRRLRSDPALACWPGKRSSGSCPKIPSCRRSTRTANQGGCRPTASLGPCSTPFDPGMNSRTTRRGSSLGWRRSSPE